MKKYQNSPSYQVGIVLGRLARPFHGQDSPIKSFEKNYVGLLSRRVGTLTDVVKTGNDIRQKLIMHREEIKYFPFRALSEFSEVVNAFPEGVAYNKDECAFGFFHGYFPGKKADDAEDETNQSAVAAAA